MACPQPSAAPYAQQHAIWDAIHHGAVGAYSVPACKACAQHNVPPVTCQRAMMPSMRTDAFDGNTSACAGGFWRAGLLLKVLAHQDSAINLSPVPCRAQSSMPNTMNFTWFLALLGAGLLFSILAFSLFLPIIILAPSKFAICFTIGSALIMSAFVSLRGWRGQLAHMFSAERLPFTVGESGMVDALQIAMHSRQWPTAA